ncbi:MAG TPA: hypothetical protein VMU43_04145 [Candidatus Acidoferrum sp.]|nr:hypothetical protein [Candidatus Acidoferrum sp.]
MSEGKKTLKQKAVNELKEYVGISLYLFIIFSLFILYKSVILAQVQVDFVLHGFELINALALGKIMLIAKDLHFADHFKNAPLIYPTLLKSFAFSILPAIFKIAEDVAVGMFHGKSFHESVSELPGGTWTGTLTYTLLLFVVLIPFFAFTELRGIFEEDRLFGAFFRSRDLLNPDASGS